MTDLDISQLDLGGLRQLQESILERSNLLEEEQRAKLLDRWNKEAAEAGFDSVEGVLGIRKRRASGTRGKVKPKYQNPNDHAQKWTGRGKAPKWAQPFKDAGNLDEILI